jgi:hypothetical protein
MFKTTLLNCFSFRFCFITLLLAISACVLVPLTSVAQFVPIGGTADEIYRTMQLIGKTDSSVSFTVRPLSAGKEVSWNSLYAFLDKADKKEYQSTFIFAGMKGKRSFLPVSVIQQYNSHHPYGWNDGAMIAAKGYQSLVSAGIYLALGPLEMQLQPEWHFAANSPYETNARYGANTGIRSNRLLAGQSSIRFSVGKFSAGVSTQNLWWGPGRHSSLLMSNNAQGFLHGFIGSKEPVNIGIGTLEWQLIGGQLGSDNRYVYENYHLKEASLLNSSRYLNAFVISYHPKWVPGLFLGMTRAMQRYTEDLSLSGSSALNKYLPILLKPFQKQNASGDDALRTDQLASFFLRWMLPKAKAEFYVEYGLNDYGVNVRDYVMSPSHSRAYLFGVKKIMPLANDTYLDLGLETTQMTQSPDYLVREAGNWYVHGQISQGYTHNNQIMGAGAGFGSNVQTAQASWVKGWSRLGLMIERVERDPLYHDANWVDISIGLLPQYRIRNMVLSGKIQFINSTNYAWDKNSNRFNLHSRLSIQYLL